MEHESGKVSAVEVDVEILFQFVLEIIFRCLVYWLFDLLFNGVWWPSDDTPLSEHNGDFTMWMTLYTCLGGIFGGLSHVVAPQLFLPTTALRVANLVSSPLIIGGIGFWIAKGRWNRRDHFWYGFGFALAFGALRLTCAA
jgi:hypothetical protein